MAYTQHQDPQAFIELFSPLNQVSRKYHPQLATKLRLQSVAAGETIIRKSRNQKLLHFLVDGTVELRESFDKRFDLNHTQPQCKKALESQIADRTSVKAKEDCLVLIANTEHIDQYLSWTQDYTIFYLDEGDISLNDDDLIDDDFQEDWDNVFIRSPLAANLSNRVIHELLTQLEDIYVHKGETIVKAKSRGDYFYIVKEGTAQVQTDSSGPFKGRRFNLRSGSYFGDEALVADTTRNATVTMATDGILARLDISAFDQLIKRHLVHPITDDIRNKQENIRVLDVRLALEYRLGHQKGSANMPINFLRQQMDKLQKAPVYVLTPANDRRAELATYLMRQAGYRAYHDSNPLAAETVAATA